MNLWVVFYMVEIIWGLGDFNIREKSYFYFYLDFLKNGCLESEGNLNCVYFFRKF